LSSWGRGHTGNKPGRQRPRTRRLSFPSETLASKCKTDESTGGRVLHERKETREERKLESPEGGNVIFAKNPSGPRKRKRKASEVIRKGSYLDSKAQKPEKGYYLFRVRGSRVGNREGWTQRSQEGSLSSMRRVGRTGQKFWVGRRKMRAASRDNKGGGKIGRRTFL